MCYDLAVLKEKESAFAKEVREHFAKFFRNYDYSKKNPDVISYDISSEEDANEVYYGTGLYLILRQTA